MIRKVKRTLSSKYPWAAWLNIVLAVFGLWLMVEITNSSAPNDTDETRFPVSLTTAGVESEDTYKRTSTYKDQEEAREIEPVASMTKKRRDPELKNKAYIQKKTAPTGGPPPEEDYATAPDNLRSTAPKIKTEVPPITKPNKFRTSISDKIAKLRSSTKTASKPENKTVKSIKYVSVWTVNVHRQPNNYSDVVSQLRWGQKVAILSQKGHWEKVETADGRRGWGHKVLFEKEPPSLEKISGLKGVVETIRVQMDGARACTVFIDLDADHPPQTQVFEGEAPRLVSNFNLMMADPKIAPTISVRNGVINAIRVGIANETNLTTRVVVDLIPGVDYVIDQVFYQEEQTYALHIKAKEA